jgi:hypothetical protein
MSPSEGRGIQIAVDQHGAPPSSEAKHPERLAAQG